MEVYYDRQKLKNELIMYLRIQKVDVVKTMSTCIYMLDNLDSKKDIAYNDTIKTLKDSIEEYETILNMLDGLAEEK